MNPAHQPEPEYNPERSHRNEGHAPDELGEGFALNHNNDQISESTLRSIHTDEELEKVVKELLANSSRIDSRDISVNVDNCHVTLSGTVKSQEERDYAESVVKLVQGVGEVTVNLVVKLNSGILPTDIGRKA